MFVHSFRLTVEKNKVSPAKEECGAFNLWEVFHGDAALESQRDGRQRSSCLKQNLRHFPSPLLMFHFLEAAAAEYGGSKTHIDCESVCTCGCWPAVAPDVPRCIGGVLFAIGNVRCRACYWTHTHTHVYTLRDLGCR